MAVVPGYVGSAAITWAASATASVAGQSIGTASADRLVVVAVTLEDNFTIDSCTIAGITATVGISVRNTTGTPDNSCAIFYAFVPTGTTATISVTLSGSSSLAGRLSVWATTGASVPRTGSNSAQGSGATQTLAGITIPTGGAAYYVFNNATSGTAVTWTNATERDDTAVATYQHSVADTTTAGTPTVTADGATANQILAGISFQPAPPQGFDQIPQNRLMPVARPNTALIALAASGLIFVPPPPDYCTFQPSAFQNNAFQMCVPNMRWHTPFGRAQPVKAPAYQNQGLPYAPAAAEDNTVTPGKWMMRFDRPPREMLGLASGEPFIPKEATRENTTNTVWPLVLGEVARPVERVAQQGDHLFVPREATIDNTTGLLWPLQVQSTKAAPIGRPAPQGYHLFIPDEATRQNTTNKVWPLVFGEKARPLPLPAQQGQHLFVPEEATVENTTNRVWPLTFGEKARPLPLPAPAGMWVFNYVTPAVDNNQTIDKWQQPLGRSVLIPRPAPPGLWAFGYPYLGVDNTIGIEKWQQPLSRSVPVPRPAPVGGAPFVPKEAVLENTVTPDNWLQRWQGPPRYWPIKVQTPPFVPREATVDNTTNTVWPLTQGEKARPRPRWAPVGGAPFVPARATIDNTTNTLWPLTFGEIARPGLRPAKQGFWAFGYPYISQDNTVTIDKWQQPLSVTLNIGWPRRNYLRGGQPFVPKQAVLENTVTPDKWLEAWRGPPRIKPRHTMPTYAPQTIAAPPNTIVGIPWLQAFKGPPRYRPRHTTPLYAVRVPPIYPNTITGIAWLQRFQGPPKYRPQRYDARYYFLRRDFIAYEQDISCEIELTVDFHLCGWGTETEAADEGIVQAESSDPWTEQTQVVDAAAEQTEQADAFEEQTESADEFDEKDECGR